MESTSKNLRDVNLSVEIRSGGLRLIVGVACKEKTTASTPIVYEVNTAQPTSDEQSRNLRIHLGLENVSSYFDYSGRCLKLPAFPRGVGMPSPGELSV